MPDIKVRIGGKFVSINEQIKEENKQYTDGAIGNLQDYIDNAFKDGVINETEAKKIESYIHTLENKKVELDKIVEELLSNSYLAGADRVNLSTAKQNHDDTYGTLITTINQVISDGKADSQERQQVDTAFVDYRNDLSVLVTMIERARKAIENARAGQIVDETRQYVDQQVQDTKNYVDGAFKDGIIEDSEFRTIKQYLNVLQAIKAEKDAQYSKLYNHPKLEGTPKTNLQTAKQDLDVKYDLLIQAINDVIADQKVTPEESQLVNSRFTDFINQLSLFAAVVEEATDAIQGKTTEDSIKETGTQLIKNSTFKSAGYQVLSETPNLENFPNSSSQVVQFINPASGYSVGWKSTTFNDETCIVNNDVGDSQTAAFSVRVVIPPNGQGKLKFAYYQDCEEYWDGLRIFINGVLVDDLTVSGNYRVWELYEIELQDGENIITFEFFKDESYSDYTDSVYIADMVVEYRDATVPDLWSYVAPAFKVDVNKRLDGQNSVRFERTDATDPSTQYYSMRANAIKVRGGETFTISAYFNSEDLSSFNPAGSGIVIGFGCYDAIGNLVTNLFSEVFVPSKVNEWERFVFTGTIPKDMGITDVYPQIRALGNGKFWFAKPLTQPGSIATPWHEYSPDFTNKWVYRDTTEIDGGTIRTGSLSFDKARGGVLALGGPDDGNGLLQLYNQDGELVAEMNAERRGFDQLYVGEFYSDSVLSRRIGLQDKYVDVVNGDDNTGDGTQENPFKTVNRALESLPKYLDENVRINVQGTGTWYEDISIEGFIGPADLTIICVNNDYYNNVWNTKLKGSIRVYRNLARVILQRFHIEYTGNNGNQVVTFDGNGASHMEYCRIYGKSDGSTPYAIYVKQQAGVQFYELELYRTSQCLIHAQYASLVGVNNIRGNGPSYAFWADRSIIMGEDPVPNCATITREIWGGKVYIEGSTKSDGYNGNPSGGGAPTPEVTRTFNSTSSGSWRNKYGGWRTDNNYVYQGEWGNYGHHKGLWFFGSALSNAVTGKTIKRMRIYCKRLNQGGNQGKVNFVFRYHNYTSRPSGEPSLGSEYVTSSFSQGQAKWVELPSKFFNNFESGSAKGIGLYTTSTSNSSYGIFSGSAKIEVTYQ